MTVRRKLCRLPWRRGLAILWMRRIALSGTAFSDGERMLLSAAEPDLPVIARSGARNETPLLRSEQAPQSPRTCRYKRGTVRLPQPSCGRLRNDIVKRAAPGVSLRVRQRRTWQSLRRYDGEGRMRLLRFARNDMITHECWL